MKRLICTLTVCCMMLTALSSLFLLNVGAQDTKELDDTTKAQLDFTDSYYYDRLNEQQQWCYDFLVEFYAEHKGEVGKKHYDWSHLLPKDCTNDDITRLYDDFIIAELAVFADFPLYKDIAKIYSIGWSDVNESAKVSFSSQINFCDYLTDYVKESTDAKIDQIVRSVGAGDRYTKLYKLTHYLITSSFYDPYLMEINHTGNNDLETKGFHYNVSAYGVLQKNIAICSGFADTVKVLCDALDIPCIIMGNKGHAWNLVQMENGEWYRLDITNAVSLGWESSMDVVGYFANTFLNNNSFVTYSDPYMLGYTGITGYFSITEFPIHATGKYQYTGSTTDFSYSLVPNTYAMGPTFSYKVNFDGKTCSITTFEGSGSGDLIIPDTIDGYTVTAILPNAFYYCTDFTGKLIIPDSVETIGAGAFAGCYNLTSVKLSKNLKMIGNGAFIGCKNITEITLPDMLESVGEYAFFDCDKLSNVTFGTHVQSVSEKAFANINAPIVIKAPGSSAAHSYAMNNGLTFETSGTQCQFVDADNDWEFEDDYHYHTCEHGARFDRESHNRDDALCQTCGRTHIPAHDCYTEDWKKWETGPDSTHYQICDMCNEKFNEGAHYGGMATTTKLAVCTVCGEPYGDYFTMPDQPANNSGNQEHGSGETSSSNVGCGSTLNVGAIAIIPVSLAAALFPIRKKKNK